jgi:uncharacterized protein YukE
VHQPRRAAGTSGSSGTSGTSGSDVELVAAGAAPALGYLSTAARHLGLPDPVQEYFGPAVGRWRDLHEQAERWRRAAHAVEELGDRLTTPLGGLDAVWNGAVADSFLEHMRRVGAAGRSVSDAMATMAEVLDRTAEAVQELVTDLVDLLSGGADRVSAAMILPIDGEQLAGRQLTEVRAHSRRVFEAVRELLEAFVEMCDGVDAGQPFAGVRMATTFPERTWSFRPDIPPVALPAPHAPTPAPTPLEPATEQPAAAMAGGSAGAGGGAGAGFGGGGGPGGAVSSAGAPAAPAPPAEPAVRTLAAEPMRADPTPAAGASAGSAAAANAAGAGSRGAPGAGFMPMGMGAGMAGQDNEHKGRSRITADPTDLFGKPTKTAPPVIGED